MERQPLHGCRLGAARYARAAALMLMAGLLSCACAATPPAGSDHSAASSHADSGVAYARTQEKRSQADAQPTMLFARNALFRFDRGIGFKIVHLVAKITPVAPHPLIVLDDPTSFRIAAEQGRVRVRPSEVEALFNHYTFAFKGAPLRDLKVQTSPGRATLSGEYRRRGWVDFKISGALKRENAHTLALVADRIVVEGREADNLLDKANVKLDAILHINTRGVRLVDNRIRLDVNELFPPPALSVDIKDVHVDNQGIVLDLAAQQPDTPKLASAPGGAKSYILLRGGDIRIMRTVVPNADLALLPKNGDQPVGLWLYHYRDQLVNGYFNYQRGSDSSFIVRLPGLDEATP